MDPKTIMDIGIVAQQTFDAKDCPANPPIINSIGICAPRNAWAMTRMVTLRFAMVSDGVMTEGVTD